MMDDWKTTDVTGEQDRRHPSDGYRGEQRRHSYNGHEEPSRRDDSRGRRAHNNNINNLTIDFDNPVSLKADSIVRGRVTRIEPYGAFVDFQTGQDYHRGLAHISQLAEGRVERVEDVLANGSTSLLYCIGSTRRWSSTSSYSSRSQGSGSSDWNENGWE